MKALLKNAQAPASLAYCDVPDPVPGEGELLIQVHAAGICGTDLSLFQWFEEVAAIYSPPIPLILGHEFSGVVVATGSAVRNDWVGRRVVVNPVTYCGTCRYCRQGRQSLCDNRPCLGLDLNGGFAEYVSVRQDNAFVIPDEVSYPHAALAEPFCVALHATEQVRVCRSDNAVVVGTGAIGLLQIVALKAAGLERCIVTGLAADRNRLEIARSLGAETVIADQVDPVEYVQKRTRGYGADVVFETSGHPSGVEQAINVAGKGGRVALIGFPHEAIALQASRIAVTEKEIIGVRAHNRRTWERCVEVLPQLTRELQLIVTHQFPLHDGLSAFDLSLEKTEGKIIMLPQVVS